LASLSLTANLEPNRYVYPTSTALLSNGVVKSFLIQASRFSERPSIVPLEVLCLHVVNRAHLAELPLPVYAEKQEGSNCPLRFIRVQATTSIFAASFTFIFRLIPRSNSRPLINRQK
jgi:hypothetical protein